MALYGVQFVVTYTAWDATNGVPKTGDVGNHTLRWIKDGTASATTNSPTEVDATNAPGEYKVTITATEAQAITGKLAGKSSTSGVSLIPQGFAFERLPNVDPGANGGLPTVDGSNRVAGVSGNVAGSVAGAVASVTGAVGSVTAAVTVGTNNDKTGYALVSTPPTASDVASAVWSASVDGLTAKQLLSAIAALLPGKLSGAGTGTEVFKQIGSNQTRVTVTVDESGNRTAVVFDWTGV